MCWAALDRASRLADDGFVPDKGARWQAAVDAIHAWIEEHGWDEELGAYIRAPELRELDASVVTLPLVEYAADRRRLNSTLDAVRERLAPGRCSTATSARTASLAARVRSRRVRSGSSTRSRVWDE